MHNDILVAKMKLLDRIIMWMIGHEGASTADIADFIMILKKEAQDEYKRDISADMKGE